jgi:hypothetical protein
MTDDNIRAFLRHIWLTGALWEAKHKHVVDKLRAAGVWVERPSVEEWLR